MLKESHTGSSTIVSIYWLNPFVTDRIVRHHIWCLFTYLSIIMNMMSKSIGIIPIVNVWSILNIMWVETLFHWCIRIDWELRLVMGKVRIFEELYPWLWNRILWQIQVWLLELTLLFWNTSKSSISCLEMGSCDVWNCNWIQTLINLSTCLRYVIELSFHCSSWIKSSCRSFKLHSGIRVLELVFDSILRRTWFLGIEPSWFLESALIICAIVISINTKSIVCP